MRPIIVDFFRRRGWLYLAGIFLTGAVDILWMAYGTDVWSCLMFAGLFTVVLLLEQKQGRIGVVATLPVSRRTTALYYWGIGVLLPVLIVAGTFILAGLLSVCWFPGRSFPFLAAHFAVVILASLIWSGGAVCVFTFFSPMARQYLACLMPVWVSLWIAPITIHVFWPSFSRFVKPGSGTWLGAAFLAILLPAVAFVRREKLVFRRVRQSSGERQSVQATKRTAAFEPLMTGFGGVFFRDMRKSFLVGLFFPALMALIVVLFHGNSFCTTPAFTRLYDEYLVISFLYALMVPSFSWGPRPLRVLPLSTGRLALILWLLPLSCMLGVLVPVVLSQRLSLVRFLDQNSLSFIIPMAGVVCIASSLGIRFGKLGIGSAIGGLLIGGMIFVFPIFGVAKWPAVFWWLPGVGLMAAAFFANRCWLRSSGSYRASGITRS